MTALRKRPTPTGLALWPLVGVVSHKLRCRKPLDGTDFGTESDVLVVQVGPAVPYRLLLVEPSPDGLIRLQLWQANGKVKVASEATCTSDLVDVVLEEWAAQYGLG